MFDIDPENQGTVSVHTGLMGDHVVYMTYGMTDPSGMRAVADLFAVGGISLDDVSRTSFVITPPRGRRKVAILRYYTAEGYIPQSVTVPKEALKTFLTALEYR